MKTTKDQPTKAGVPSQKTVGTAAKKQTAEPKKGVVKAKPDAAKDLRDFFEDGLKDIYWAEKALTKALPKMAKNATASQLIHAFEHHLKETEEHVIRLEKVFESLGLKAVGKKCDAMAGLLDEANGIIEETKVGDVRDAAMIAAAQKVEHYEIATYGTLRVYAVTLGETKAALLFAKTLEEEKNADVKLTEIAMAHINVDAAQEGHK
ncbi:ferritin-like domain-containing protein [Flavobacterium sinopsychrotolerans]|uniref:Ferritin-like metal-binding protein YciE n=1 Tax=Flavobacterium sinopsychrotolerans TaxID=604089 RepID=A0A1H8LDB8_9FLAO|nr:ferritin-like domain-containing protein [Flavobacterium sinopsychrotolerans]SEO02796.1 Ferritin-like metal-binding protein YciE [Flavobacterium sinopsychrotolerans]